MAGTTLDRSSSLDPSAYEDHRRYVVAVLARRCRWLPEDERAATLHDAWAVMLDKERSGALDVSAMSAQQIRAYLTQTALNRALDEGRRSRHRDEPLGERDDFVATGAEPHELADALLEGTRVREILGELTARQQTIVKLRFFFDRSPEEIQQLLSVTERIYRRELERAMAVVAERYELVRDGRFCESRASLIRAYVAGIAGPNRVRDAREHLAGCSACRRMALDLRRAAGQVAGVAPLPPLLHEHHDVAPVLDAVGHVRRSTGRLATSVRAHLGDLLTRIDASTPTTVTAARPGAIVATLGACAAVGGGATYCVVNPLPAPVRHLIGHAHHHQPARHELARVKPAARTVVARAPAPAPVTTAVATSPARPTAMSARATRKARALKVKAAAHAAAKRSAAAASREFGFEGAGSTGSGTSTGAARTPTATAARAGTTSGSGAGASTGGSAGGSAAAAREFGP